MGPIRLLRHAEISWKNSRHIVSVVLKQQLVAWSALRNELTDGFSAGGWKWTQLPGDNSFFFICSWDKCTSVFWRYLSTREANLSFAKLCGLMCIWGGGVKWSLTTNLDIVKHKRASSHYFSPETVLSGRVLLTEAMHVQQVHSAARPHSSSSFPLMMAFILHSQILFMPPMPFTFLALAFC